MQHRDMMFGYSVGFSVSADLMMQLSTFKKFKMVAHGHIGYTKWPYNFSTGLPIDLFSSMVGFTAKLKFIRMLGAFTHALLSRAYLCDSLVFLFE